MTPETRLKASPDAVTRHLDGETVIMHLESGTYFGLDPVGAHAWAAIEESRDGVSIRAVCDAISARFDAPDDVVERDILALSQELADHKLITVAGH